MNTINKVFVGGCVHSGKNILWRLLDGHPSVTSNCMHSNLGYFVLNEKCKKFFLREKSSLTTDTFPFVPTCKIAYSTGETATVDVGNFFYGLYSFSTYRSFISWAKGNSMFVNIKEGELARFPLNFDINGFEKSLENLLFTNDKTYSEDEVLDVIYLSYIKNLENKKSKNASIKSKYFIDTLVNGIEHPQNVVEKIPDAKCIVMTRDLESLLFANASRILAYKGIVDRKSIEFKKILYNQNNFKNKMKVFNEKAIKLSESSKNIALIDFKDLVLNTEDTMKHLSEFIGINFEKILISPSINGQEIDNETYKIIGNINDDPNKYLSKNEMDVLMYSINGFNKKYSFFKNLVIFLKLLKWRLFPNTISLIKKLLSKVLSRRLYSLIRSYYKEKI